MADDQSRPSENEHQDAESEARRAPEDAESDAPNGDDAAESGAGGATVDPDAEASDEGDETANADETPVAEGTPEADGTLDENETAETDDATDADETPEANDADAENVPAEIRKYERFKKMDGAQYDRVNEFLRERTYITAREWAIARLCADFRTETGVEMTKIGENLPELVPFMTDTYTPQAVNQARSSFENKVRQAGATFLYGAMSGFFTAEELDDMMYEVTEVAKFLLEVEGVDLSVDEELEAEDRISGVMREVQSASEQLRHDELECPNCGHEMEEADATEVESDD